jgi:hypothetical protein
VSYEIYLVAARPGEDPGDAVDRALDVSEGAAGPAPGGAEDLLRDELGDDPPVDVDGGGEHVLVTVPYLRSADADGLFRDVFAAVTQVQARTGWVVYDPQLGRALDLPTDLPAVVETFRDTIAVRDEFA